MLTSNDIVRGAWKAGVMVPAFNIPHLPIVQPVISAVADVDCFAFMAVARLEWTKFQAKSLAAVMDEFTKWDRPECVRLHLDHVPVIDEDDLEVDYLAIIDEAVDLGYHSVMVDGSRLDLEGNIEATKRVADRAHAGGIACEAELGAVLGHEAGPPPPYEELFASGRGFTDVDEAKRFVVESGCDWLSVAIGNIHGAVSETLRDKKKVEARLNLDHLETLREATGVPLVLHGGSGVQQEYVLKAMKSGIAKINIGTEIRQTYENALRESNDVQEAQQAVYDRTVSLIRDYFGIAGTREQVLAQIEGA